METDINWLDLSDRVWKLILSNLNYKSLLNASGTCKKFNVLLAMSQRLMKKLSLQIGNPFGERFETVLDKENAYDEYLYELKLMKECLQKSERKYDSIIIWVLKDRAPENYIMYYLIFEILKQLVESVDQITFFRTPLQDDNFFKVIQILKNLKVLKFKEYGDDYLKQTKTVTNIVRPNNVSLINEISIIEVGKKFSFEMLYLFDTITTLKVSVCVSTIFKGITMEGDPPFDYETFHSFLLKQKCLKVLHLKNLRSLFKSDKLSYNFRFSLDELFLDSVYWTSNNNAIMFFNKQTELKKVQLTLKHFEPVSYKLCFNDLIIQLFGKNDHLKTVVLSTCASNGYNIVDFSFLEGIVNLSVENLDLDLFPSQNVTKLIDAFTKLFPNVKSLTYGIVNEDDHGLNQIQNWKSLESIKCYQTNINKFLEHINVGEKLTTCTINCTHVIRIKRPILMQFLTRHQNIKYFSSNTPAFKKYLDEDLSIIVKDLKKIQYQGNSLSNYLTKKEFLVKLFEKIQSIYILTSIWSIDR